MSESPSLADRSCGIKENESSPSRIPGDAGSAPGWRRSAIDFLCPPSCAVCRTSTVGSAPLCPRCLRDLDWGATNFCLRCGAPVGPHLDTSAGCFHCRDDRFAFERAFAYGVYDGPLRSACLRMKHELGDRLAHVLTDRLWERWGEALQALKVDVIVPVPAHWTTRWRRIAHPAGSIAERVGELLKAPVDLHILRKPRRTPAQASLSPTERRENLRDAFRLARGVRLHGARVLLVDDVLTTGTTADRVARVLRTGGATSVHVAVIARGIGQW